MHQSKNSKTTADARETLRRSRAAAEARDENAASQAQAEAEDIGAEPCEVAPLEVASPGVATSTEAFSLTDLAAALCDERQVFLEMLGRCVENDVAREQLMERRDEEDESASFEDIVLVFVEDCAPAASVVGAALAARTVARSLFAPGTTLETGDAENLLSAWLGAAHAVEKLRGVEGLLRLLPAARNLIRRAEGLGEGAPAIADAMRRVAVRIADTEQSLGRAPRRLSQRPERERMRDDANDISRRFVIRGQLELTFHAR